ncbi:hypothetical protein Tco_0404471 [Tanacetum coccineum]
MSPCFLEFPPIHQVSPSPLALLQSNMLELMRLYSSLVQLIIEAKDNRYSCVNIEVNDVLLQHRSDYRRLEFRVVVCELLGDGASWSTVVEEGEPVDAAGSRATTSAIRAMTSGAGRSTLDEGLSNSSNSG